MVRFLPGPAGWVFLFALVVRLWSAGRCTVPSVDGVIFLHMAEELAAGRWAQAFDRVFHPLYPLFLAPFTFLDSYTAARILLALAGAAGAALVLPLARLLGASPGAALGASLLAALAVYPVRYVGDAYSEPLFILLVAAAGCLHLRQAAGRGGAVSALAAGALAGLAFTARPEGAALVAAFLLAGPRRGALAAGAAAPVLPFLVLRGLLAGGFTLTPKIAFMAPLGPLGAEGPLAGAGLYLANLGLALVKGWEALDYLGWLLFLLGLVAFWRKRELRRPGATALVLALLIALAGMALFQVKRRFIADWSPLLLALGALGLGRASGKERSLLTGLLCLSLLFSGWRLLPPRKADRLAEVEVGRWLGGRLRPGEGICTDMPRIAYYAGLPPPPPRVPTPADLAARCIDPRVRYLVLGARRALLARFGPPPPWRPQALPPELAAAARTRGIRVFRRRSGPARFK